MSASSTTLDRHGLRQACLFAALAQILGLALACGLASGPLLPASGAQFALALVYTALSSGMALQTASRLQAVRLARR